MNKGPSRNELSFFDHFNFQTHPHPCSSMPHFFELPPTHSTSFSAFQLNYYDMYITNQFDNCIYIFVNRTIKIPLDRKLKMSIEQL